MSTSDYTAGRRFEREVCLEKKKKQVACLKHNLEGFCGSISVSMKDFVEIENRIDAAFPDVSEVKE